MSVYIYRKIDSAKWTLETDKSVSVQLNEAGVEIFQQFKDSTRYSILLQDLEVIEELRGVLDDAGSILKQNVELDKNTEETTK